MRKRSKQKERVKRKHDVAQEQKKRETPLRKELKEETMLGGLRGDEVTVIEILGEVKEGISKKLVFRVDGR